MVAALVAACLGAVVAPCRSHADGPAAATQPVLASEPPFSSTSEPPPAPPAGPSRTVEPEQAPPLRWEPPDPWATFVYVKPAPVTRLRLFVEEASIMVIAFTGYVIWNPPPADEGVPAKSIWDKLTFQPQSWYFDADSIATNFAGHPTSGTFYYMFARSNRVSVAEASLWTLGMSTVWELIEYKEPVSINDMIATPAGGIAIGEGFVQLSAWFDRSGEDGLSKALAWIFDPMKKIHDWMDKAEPRRDPEYRGWHEFRVNGSGVLVWQDGQVYPGFEFDISTKLFRAPGYGEAGGTGYGFADGNVSAMAMTATFAADRTVDFLFETETALVGHYSRALQRDVDGLSGWDLFVGGTAAYEFGSHVWNVAANQPKNQIALVRIPGVDARFRLFAGPLQLDCSLDAAFDFGGVEPLGAPTADALASGQAFPTVYDIQGYYFGYGLHLAPALEVRYGIVGLGASWRADWLWGITGPFIPQPDGQVVVLSDSRTTGKAWLRLRVPDPRVEFALTGMNRERRGTAGTQVSSAQEHSLLASFGILF
jgi:hypothetical protein